MKEVKYHIVTFLLLVSENGEETQVDQKKILQHYNMETEILISKTNQQLLNCRIQKAWETISIIWSRRSNYSIAQQKEKQTKKR